MPNASVCVGVIAEDESDVNTARVLIKRICGHQLGVKHFCGHGCGRIKSKCRGWAEELRRRGCTFLILLHDRDSRRLEELSAELDSVLKDCAIAEHLLCIPVEELEAWLLSDPQAIAQALGLDKPPKIPINTELISSPKEFLQKLVRKASNGQKIYVHTRHNEKVAGYLRLDRAQRCPSFVPFYSFVTKKIRPKTLLARGPISTKHVASIC
jgi:hypothetical protein